MTNPARAICSASEATDRFDPPNPWAMITAGAGVCAGRYSVESSCTGSFTPGPPGAVMVRSLVAIGVGPGFGQAIQTTAATSATTTTMAVILPERVLNNPRH